MTQVLTAVAGTVLAISAMLALLRVIRGPTVLNRAIALDVLVAILISALGLEAAYNEHTTTIPIMVALGLIGFVGSVSVARFAARDERADEETDAPTTLGVET
jgi:multicomponent Na+:H+ antiporter subunit F